MPILQNIQIAEAEAEKLRQNAHTEVEELKQRTKKEAEEEAIRIAKEVEEKIKANNQNTLKLIDKLEKENFDNISKTKATLELLAKKNQEIGVNYILKKVFEV